MIYNTKADLMYPGVDGLGGIGAIGDIPWSCSTFGLFCQDPITQTREDTSAYGGSLSQPNRDWATSMAVDAVRADMINNPCSYSASNEMSTLDQIFKCGQVNWLVVGAVIGGSILLMGRR